MESDDVDQATPSRAVAVLRTIAIAATVVHVDFTPNHVARRGGGRGKSEE